MHKHYNRDIKYKRTVLKAAKHCAGYGINCMEQNLTLSKIVYNIRLIILHKKNLMVNTKCKYGNCKNTTERKKLYNRLKRYEAELFGYEKVVDILSMTDYSRATSGMLRKGPRY